MQDMSVPILVIAGPTASGKSALALRLAERLGGEIVNADAMQVYRDLRVITARPSREDEQHAPHHLYGHVDAALRHSAGAWAHEARSVIADIEARGARPVIVGGSGLYLQALLQGLADMPDPGDDARAEARRIAEEEGADALLAKARVLDAEAVDALAVADRQRLERIVAIALGTGRSLTDWRAEQGGPALDPARWRGLIVDPGRDVSRTRIAARARRMLVEGAVEEVERLVARKLDAALPAMKAIGVPEISALIAGEANLEETAEAITIATRQYAKRQRTWLRGRQGDWPILADPADIDAARAEFSSPPG